jgi:clan AA aspartic protease (TIGR02281 family)
MLSRHKITRIGSALLAGLAVCGCQNGEDAGHCAMAHVTDLPLVHQGNAFFTPIMINGQSAELLFDTGSDDNMLLETTAHRLGLSIQRYNEIHVEGIGGSREVGTVHSRQVRLGNAHGEDLTFLATPGNAGDEDGILGMNFLYPFDLDLDFWGHRIGLYKALSGCKTPHTAMTGSLYTVQLAPTPLEERYDHGELRPPHNLRSAIYVSINGERFRAVIDTGAPHTAMFRDSARRAGLDDADALGGASVIGVGSRAVKAQVRMSAAVVIGDLTVKNMPIVVLDQRHMPNTDILLGHDFVTRVHIWISRSSGTVIMQYPPQPTPAEVGEEQG